MTERSFNVLDSGREIPDPAALEGTLEQRAKAFLDAAIVLKRRIELMLALPIERLDAIGLQREVRNIGKQ